MIDLSSAERRSLRARAHALRPVVSVGQHGLTPAVVHEIDVALAAHELIKIRVHDDDRDTREAFLARICDELGAAAVQHLGKLLIVYRPKPEVASTPKPVRARKQTKGGGKTARNPAPVLAGSKRAVAAHRSPAAARKKAPTGVSRALGASRFDEPAPRGSFAPAADASRRRRRVTSVASTATKDTRNPPTARRGRKR